MSQSIPNVTVRGRPKRDFIESSKRTKRRKIAKLSKSDESIACALRSCNLSSPAFSEFSADEVLSILVETGLSKQQYLTIRSFINTKTSYNLLPSYEKLLAAKAASCPVSINVSDSQADVELQSLVDHTASRIVQLQADVLDSIDDYDLTLIGKWGFDDSSGQKTINDFDDSSLFVTSYVPLQLIKFQTNKVSI